MALVGPLSNPSIRQSWADLAGVMAEVRASGAPIWRAKRTYKIRRPGQVRKVIVKLLKVNGTMRTKQIHQAVEHELGEAVAWSSVVGCLSANSRGKGALFRKIGHGRYQIEAALHGSD
ncbi:MAG: hypothetical protein WCB49_06715 [Gammaproteobacteria bacterium]